MTDDPLRALFKEEPDPPNPLTGAQLRALAEHGGPDLRWLQALAASVVLGSGLLALALVTGDTPELRARGPADHGEVTLRWIVEGTSPPRLGAPSVGPDERVIFRLGTTAPGFLCVFEETPDGFVRVVPAEGGWPVEAGEHVPRLGDAIAAFVTDHGPGERRYRAALDREDPECANPEATATTTLTWISE